MWRKICTFLCAVLLLLSFTAVPADASSPLISSSTAKEAATSWIDSLLGRLYNSEGIPAQATSTPATSTPAISEVKGFLDRINEWFHETLGVDFYQLLRIVTGFAVAVLKLLLGLAGRLVEWLDGILAAS